MDRLTVQYIDIIDFISHRMQQCSQTYTHMNAHKCKEEKENTVKTM